MASLWVLAFDHEGRPVQFDTWLDDLQLYLLSDSKDSVSLFDLASGAATSPPATADTQALYDAVVARYLSPATAALGRLLLPYLFPELSAISTVEDLVSHLRASDDRYRATVPAEFLDRNPPPMYTTLYLIVIRLPDSLCSVRDHFLSLDPTSPLLTSSSSISSQLRLVQLLLVLPGTAPAEALHTFTLDSCASRCFFRDNTTLTPLPALVPVRLADPSGGPVMARSFTVLPCPAVPFGSLSDLHLPSFSTNLVSTAALHDAMVTTTTPGGSSLYTLATEPSQVAASAQVSASGQVATSCSCRLLSHQTLLWHHRLGHPSLPRLRGMHSRLLVFSLPRSLPRPASLASRGGSAPLLTPPRFPRRLLPCRPSTWTFDNYTRYTTVFPLRNKGQVVDVLIPWIHTVRLQLREWFGQDLPVLRLHSSRGGEFSSNLLRDFCHGEGILQSFTLPDSPQKNEIAERRIGLVMEVARTSMIHAAAPHFMWPFTVR
ncbi:unnamed protein product [Closterium sp. NIES-53]